MPCLRPHFSGSNLSPSSRSGGIRALRILLGHPEIRDVAMDSCETLLRMLGAELQWPPTVLRKIFVVLSSHEDVPPSIPHDVDLVAMIAARLGNETAWWNYANVVAWIYEETPDLIVDGLRETLDYLNSETCPLSAVNPDPGFLADALELNPAERALLEYACLERNSGLRWLLMLIVDLFPERAYALLASATGLDVPDVRSALAPTGKLQCNKLILVDETAHDLRHFFGLAVRGQYLLSMKFSSIHEMREFLAEGRMGRVEARPVSGALSAETLRAIDVLYLDNFRASVHFKVVQSYFSLKGLQQHAQGAMQAMEILPDCRDQYEKFSERLTPLVAGLNQLVTDFFGQTNHDTASEIPVQWDFVEIPAVDEEEMAVTTLTAAGLSAIEVLKVRVGRALSQVSDSGVAWGGWFQIQPHLTLKPIPERPFYQSGEMLPFCGSLHQLDVHWQSLLNKPLTPLFLDSALCPLARLPQFDCVDMTISTSWDKSTFQYRTESGREHADAN